MTLQFQHLRGVTEKVSVYTGLPGELVIDLSSKQIFVQDGVTAGGIGVAKDQLVTSSSRGLMSPLDKLKLDGIAAGANKYELPTAGASLGGVKTTSTVSNASGYTPCPIIAGVPYYKPVSVEYSAGTGLTLSNGVFSLSLTKDLVTTALGYTPPIQNTTYLAGTGLDLSGTTFSVTSTAGTSTLAWNTEVTLATVGGLAIKAKLPANPNTNTWIAMVGATSSAAGTAGYVPAPPKDGYNTKYLRADGTWAVPPDNNTTYTFTAGTSTLAWNTEVTLATVGGLAIKAKLPANPHSSTATAVRPANLANGAYSDVVSSFAADKSTSGSANRVATIRLTNGDGFNEMLLGVHNEANAAPIGIYIKNTNGTVTTTISGTTIGTFQGNVTGDCTGNAATATKIHRVPSGVTYVAAVTAGNALINSTATSFGALWNAPTKNYRVGCATHPQSNDNVYICYSVTNANVTAGTNTPAKTLIWNADTGILSASGGFNGNAATATKATQDSAGQQINTTYIKALSVNGKTITYTKGDDTTGTITTKDTTYSVATTSANGLMSKTDKANLDNLVSQMATLVTQVETISDKLNSLLAKMDTYYSGYTGYPRS